MNGSDAIGNFFLILLASTLLSVFSAALLRSVSLTPRRSRCSTVSECGKPELTSMSIPSASASFGPLASETACAFFLASLVWAANFSRPSAFRLSRMRLARNADLISLSIRLADGAPEFSRSCCCFSIRLKSLRLLSISATARSNSASKSTGGSLAGCALVIATEPFTALPSELAKLAAAEVPTTSGLPSPRSSSASKLASSALTASEVRSFCRS